MSWVGLTAGAERRSRSSSIGELLVVIVRQRAEVAELLPDRIEEAVDVVLHRAKSRGKVS